MVDVAAVVGYMVWLLNIPDWKLRCRTERSQYYLLELGKALAMP